MDTQVSAEDLVRATLERHAPAEVAYLGDVTRMVAEHPEIMYDGRDRPGPLADGLSLVLVIAGPILYGVLNDLARQALSAGIGAAFRRLLRLGRRRLALDTCAPLSAYTKEQILHARAAVTSRLLERGVDAELAAAIAEDFARELERVR